MISVKKQGPFEVFSRGAEEPWAIWRDGRPFKQAWTWVEVEAILRGDKTKRSHSTKVAPTYTVIVWSCAGEPTFVTRDEKNRAAALALGEKHQADVVENYGNFDERTIRIQK